MAPVGPRKPEEHGGLAALVKSELHKDPFTGTVFVFRSRRADRLKLLYWDRTGLVMAYQQTLDVPLTVTDFALRIGISRRKPERHYTKGPALTPMEAGMKIRLLQAQLLLERGDRSVNQIAVETGFCDASHLIRLFRAAEGITPEVWRNAPRVADGSTAHLPTQG